MTDALLADLRAHADDLRRDMEELPGHPQWNQWYGEESHLRHLIAKHETEPDVSRGAATFDGTCPACDADVRCQECGCDFDPAYYSTLTPKPDVSERDELARVLADQGLYCGDHDDLPAMGECAVCDRDRLQWADAILAAGWRRR